MRKLLLLSAAAVVLVAQDRPIVLKTSTLLDGKGLAYEEIALDDDPGFRARIHALTGARTVPQILIDGDPIGGYTELRQLDRDGRLDERLAAGHA